MNMSRTIAVTLPGGYWVDGECFRGAEIRALTGEDEAFLLESGDSLLPAHRTTALLARCVARLGSAIPVTSDAIRQLTVGDREALLLHLRRLTFGDSLRCVLGCPEPECGERMDLELRTGDFLLPPYPRRNPRTEIRLRENGETYRIRFRLPTGGDQEAVADLALTDVEAASDLLLRRCVESVTASDGDAVRIEDLSTIKTRRLPAVMAELDPQAEIALNMVCPSCGHNFSTVFDTGDFFYRELRGRTRNLHREVHLLAFYYHWSESEILAMTSKRRQLYLSLLAEALSEGGRG